MASQESKTEHYHFRHGLRAGEMTRQHYSNVSTETVTKRIPEDKNTLSLGTPLLGLDLRSPGTWALYSQMLPFIFSEAPAAASHRISVPRLSVEGVQALISPRQVVSPEITNQLTEPNKQLKDVVDLLLKNQGQVAPNRERAVSDALTAAAEGAAEGDTRLQRALELLKANNIAEAEPLLRSVAEDKERAAASGGEGAATAYRNLGAISGLADLKRAREAYARATALDPDNPDGLFWAGWFELEAGDLDGTENLYTRLLQLDGKGATKDQILWARVGLGDIAVARGNLLDALTSYRDSLAIAEDLAKADPGRAGWQRDLSLSHEKVGDVLVAQGKLTDALKSYRESLAIRERLAEDDPSNAGWQRDLSLSYDNVGDVLEAQGNLFDALKSYRDSLAIAERLAKDDPGDVQRQRDLSLSYDNVGDALEAQGNLPDALKTYRDSLGIRERLAGVDPSNAASQIDVLRAQWRLAAHGDDAAQRWAFIVSTLRRLKSENKLTTEQAALLPKAEEELSKIARP